MGRLLRSLSGLLHRTPRTSDHELRPFVGKPGPPPTRAQAPREPHRAPQVEYAVEIDGEPDPGEVVWAWVPYEEDPTQGKDRPVLLLAREGRTWSALMLTSKDHTREPEREARHGRHWMDVGTGGWDSQRRPSEVRLDRLVQLDESAIRREGAGLDRRTFDAVVARAHAFHRFG